MNGFPDRWNVSLVICRTQIQSPDFEWTNAPREYIPSEGSDGSSNLPSQLHHKGKKKSPEHIQHSLEAKKRRREANVGA